jgi:Holliday junction resolvasome RuvABC endonuclease subunit
MSSFVVGIDPSLTRAGVCALRSSNPTHPAVLRDTGYSLPETATWDDRIVRVEKQTIAIGRILDQLRAQGTIEQVLIEAPIFPKHVKPSYFDRAALWSGIYSAIKARKLPRAVVAPTTLKKWATGAGRADKELVQAEVAKWWPNVEIANDDIADATVLAAMAGVHLGWTMPFETRRRHVEGMVTVNWPQPDEIAI